MKKVEFLKLNAEVLKLMSKIGLRSDDYKYIAAYEIFLCMRKKGVKVDILLSDIAKRFKTSESTLKRAFRRLSGEVIV